MTGHEITFTVLVAVAVAYIITYFRLKQCNGDLFVKWSYAERRWKEEEEKVNEETRKRVRAEDMMKEARIERDVSDKNLSISKRNLVEANDKIRTLIRDENHRVNLQADGILAEIKAKRVGPAPGINVTDLFKTIQKEMENKLEWTDDLVHEFMQWVFDNRAKPEFEGVMMLAHFKEMKSRKHVFITEDGVKIYSGDAYWIMFPNYALSEATAIHTDAIPVRDDLKRFSTKEIAENYVAQVKPALSRQDIIEQYRSFSSYASRVHTRLSAAVEFRDHLIDHIKSKSK